MLGTWFIVKGYLNASVVKFKSVSDCLCVLRLTREVPTKTFISIPAPSEDKDIELKEDFYNEVNRVFEGQPRYNMT